jgi:hypothetical protein
MSKYVLTIGLIEDRGISKTLHFHKVGSNDVKGYVTVNESHDWYNKQVGDELTLDA